MVGNMDNAGQQDQRTGKGTVLSGVVRVSFWKGPFEQRLDWDKGVIQVAVCKGELPAEETASGRAEAGAWLVYWRFA